METLLRVFGEGKDLTVLQMSARAVVIYFIALLYIRISGRRTFGKKSSFDTTIAIILGAVLSRAIAGASPFLPTIAASLVLVLIHRYLAVFIIHNKHFSKFIKGERRVLYQNGRINDANLKKCLMTYEDMLSDVRLKTHADNLDEVDAVYMENSGELSVMLKKHHTRRMVA
jgi:uncharacterized membrane protein YcaP (DUF421 family)